MVIKRTRLIYISLVLFIILITGFIYLSKIQIIDIKKNEFKEVYNQSIFNCKFNEISISNSEIENITMMGIDNNNIFYSGIKNDNIVYGIYQLNNNTYNIIYEVNPNSNFSIDPIIINSNMYILEFIIDQKESYFILKKITPKGEKIEILKDRAVQIPFITSVDDNIIINYSFNENKKYKDKLILINTENLENTQIEELTYSINQNGYYTGETIVYAGGLKEGFFYQILTLDNTELHLGEPSIKYYSLIEEQIVFENKIPEILSYISGTENFLLASKYGYERALNNSASIIFLPSQEKVSLEEFSTTNDIISSYLINENKLILVNNNHIFIYDLKKFNYFKFNYKDSNNKNKKYSKIYIDNQSIGYSESIGNETTFFISKISNIK